MRDLQLQCEANIRELHQLQVKHLKYNIYEWKNVKSQLLPLKELISIPALCTALFHLSHLHWTLLHEDHFCDLCHSVTENSCTSALILDYLESLVKYQAWFEAMNFWAIVSQTAFMLNLGVGN